MTTQEVAEQLVRDWNGDCPATLRGLAGRVAAALDAEREQAAAVVENHVRLDLHTTADGWTPIPDPDKIAAYIRRRGPGH